MLETKDLSKVYKPKKGEPVVALDKVSIKFPSKGMVFLLGKSGSGKSTLLNLLGGLDKYDSGEIKIKGVSSKSFRQQHFDSYRNTYVGFIFQEYNILDDFSVGANIALAIELQNRKATNEEINAILREVDLEGYGDRKPNELSGGQKQRVAIARALVKKPEIIMADEPTGALDSNTGRQVFDTLKKLSKDRLVLIVSHDRDFSEYYADRIIELSDGRVLSDVEYAIDQDSDKNEQIEFSENSIDLPMGYMLTEEDRIAINEYIKALNNNDIVSINLQKNTRKAFFKKTDEGKVESQDGKSFKLIKSKLPLKNAFKIGASGLKHKKFRLFVTIFLCLISFTMFGLTDTIASYNNYRANVTSIMDSNIDYASFSKNRRQTYGNGKNDFNWAEVQNGITDGDIKNIKDKTGVNVMGVFSVGKHTLTLNNNYRTSEGKTESVVYTPGLSGVVDITPDLFNNLGYSLIAGEMPKKGEKEIVITKFSFQIFNGNYYIPYTSEDNTEVKIENYADLIGKEVFLGENYGVYKISGIVDTGFNDERYSKLDNIDGFGQMLDGIQAYLLLNELEELKSYSTHTLVYASEGTTKTIMVNNETAANATDRHGSIVVKIPHDYGDYIHWETVGFGFYNKFSEIEKTDVLWLGGEKTALADNEIVISLNAYINLLANNAWNQKGNDYARNGEPLLTLKYNNGELFMEFYEVWDIIYNFESIMLFTYAKDNLDEAKELFKHSYPEVDIAIVPDRDIVNEYMSHLIKNTVNPFGKTKTLIYNESFPELIEKYNLKYENNKLTLSMDSYTANKITNIDNIKIAGIISSNMQGEDWYSKSDIIIVNDRLIGEFAHGEGGKYNYALGVMPKDRGGVEKVVRVSLDESQNTRLKLNNPASDSLEMVDRFLSQIAKVFFWIGFAFAVFASVMFSNFIATSITHKKRDIGILRAIGSRGNDVFRIFFAESFIIALINFILSFSATAVIASLINNKMRTQYDLLITILNVGIRQFVLMFAICLFIAFIASFIPIKKIASKSPIDAISNR